MTRSRWIATAVGLVAVLAVVLAVVLTRSGGDDTATSPTTGGASSSPGASASSTPSATRSPASEIAPVDPQSAAPGSTAPSGLPGLAASPRPLITPPLPEAASATGSLVPGYPRRVVPVLTGATVRSSSLSPSGDVLQVALVASTTASPEDVLRFYSVRLARLGFTSTPAPAVGGSVAASYRRGASSMVVSVPATSTGARDYSVLATLRVEES